MQCGIACLAMICKHYGREYSHESLSCHCHATTEGVSMLGINEAAAALGFHTTCGRVTMAQLIKAPLPCILHWNQKHFVVLYQVKKGVMFCVADPAKGLMKYGESEFKEHWISTCSQGEERGIALFLKPTHLFYKQEEETTKEKRSFRFLFGYLYQYRSYWGQIVLGAFVGSLLQLLFPFLTQAIVDIGIHQQKLSFIYLVLVGQLMLGYYPVLSGMIRIGKVNLVDYHLKWWRRQCGVVMQEGVIFSESIARNIAVDDGEIDTDRLVKAAEIANIGIVI